MADPVTPPPAKVGDVITKGPIPANVAWIRDSDGDPYEATDATPRGWALGGALPGMLGWSDEYVVRLYGPLTVTEVRKPEPAPLSEKYAAVPQPEGDLLDLVRQYGDEIGGSVAAGECAGPDEVWRHEQSAQGLFARIEAEVQRLRADRDDLQKLFELQYDRMTQAVEIWRAEAPEERAQVLLPDFGDLMAWLLRRVSDQGREFVVVSSEAEHYRIERDDYRARLKATDASWAEVAAERDALRVKLEKGHVCTAACRPNSHVAFVGRHALDEALAEVERLKAELTEAHAAFDRVHDAHEAYVKTVTTLPGRTEQARNGYGAPWWIHACGRPYVSGEMPAPTECDACETGPWRPLLVAAQFQDGRVVLRLPEVPDGATLAGASGHRYILRGGVWDDEHGPWSGKLGHVLQREHPEGVTVEFKPLAEPRTWPQLDEAPVGLAHVKVNGREFTSVDGAYWDEVGSTAEYAWPMLLALGDVTEVVE